MRTDDTFYNWFVLNNKLPNPSVIKRLFDMCGSTEEILKKYTDQELQKEYEYAEEAQQICLENNITAITIEDPNYPVNLKQISDPPTIIYAKGRAPSRNEKMIAIVGSRKASMYSRSYAKGIARNIANKGITVISGMAEGSDMAAHQGALYTQKRTIAVLGRSLTLKRKRETTKTKKDQETIDRILENDGCIISEVEPWENYDSGKNGARLVKRNRITTALSSAVIITECDEKSGTMHAVRYAKEQGKPVYAVPLSWGKSNYYDHMYELEQRKILKFLDKDIAEQIIFNINQNSQE